MRGKSVANCKVYCVRGLALRKRMSVLEELNSSILYNVNQALCAVLDALVHLGPKELRDRRPLRDVQWSRGRGKAGEDPRRSRRQAGCGVPVDRGEQPPVLVELDDGEGEEPAGHRFQAPARPPGGILERMQATGQAVGVQTGKNTPPAGPAQGALIEQIRDSTIPARIVLHDRADLGKRSNDCSLLQFGQSNLQIGTAGSRLSAPHLRRTSGGATGVRLGQWRHVEDQSLSTISQLAAEGAPKHVRSPVGFRRVAGRQPGFQFVFTWILQAVPGRIVSLYTRVPRCSVLDLPSF